jgi:outer membrane lipoprotein-sorting protein
MNFSPRARWVVPGGVLAAVGAVMAGALISTAQASPALPHRTPAQLLAAVAGRTGPLPALTGTVVESASFGLPQLPGTDNPTSVESLLTGSHTVRVWYANSRHFRLAVPGAMSETDLIVNGRTAWLWQSTTNSVTRLLLPSRSGDAATPAPAPAMALTPQQAARQALAAVGPSTRVTVQSNVTVAGEAAYQLVLAPKTSSSLVGQVRIAVDGARDVPLRVQIFARGATSPAFQVGYTSVSFVAPAASNFDFTPPRGAKVSKDTLGSSDWSGHARSTMRRSEAAPTVMGKDWLTVAVLPAAALSGLHGSVSGASSAASSAALSASGSSPGSPGGGSGENSALFGALMGSASHVHGAWGSGRLLHSSLLSVLITDNGRILAGAVTPSVLYADAAQAK